MLTIAGFSLFLEEKCCKGVIFNMGCFGTAKLSQPSCPSHTRHTVSPLPNSDVTVMWSLPASTSKIFECQRFKNCLYPSRLNSFINYVRKFFVPETWDWKPQLKQLQCAGTAVLWAHTGLMTQHQLNHWFCLVPLTQGETLGVTPGVRWHLLGLHGWDQDQGGPLSLRDWLSTGTAWGVWPLVFLNERERKCSPPSLLTFKSHWEAHYIPCCI